MSTDNTTDSLLSVPDACRAARVCNRQLYTLLKRGDLNAVKAGRRTFIWRSEIDRYLGQLPAYASRAAA